jgi:hypothetical protein
MENEAAGLPPSEGVDPTPPGGVLGHPEQPWDIAKEMGLSDVQMRAIELTVRGMADVHIAKAISINRRTLWRWKTFDLSYQNALADARHEIYTNAADRYQNLLVRATAVLSKLLDDSAEVTRYRAAQTVLNMAGNFHGRAVLSGLIESKTRETRAAEPPREPEPDLPYKMG